MKKKGGSIKEEHAILLEDLLHSKERILSTDPHPQKIIDFLDYCVLYSYQLTLPAFRRDLPVYFTYWRNYYRRKHGKFYKGNLFYINKFEGRSPLQDIAGSPPHHQKDITHAFATLEELKKFYADKIYQNLLEKIIGEAKKLFIYRKKFSAKENRHQLCLKVQSLILKNLAG